MNRNTPERTRSNALRPSGEKRGDIIASIVLMGLTLAGCETTVVDEIPKIRQGDSESMREGITEIGTKLYAMEQSGISYDEGALSAVELLKEIVEQPNVPPLNRAQALSALGRLKRPDVGQLYVRLLADPYWLVRFEAARAIYRNPRPETAKPLIEQLERERLLEVQIELVRALIAVDTDDALKMMLKILIDDETGRYSAMRLKAYDGAVKMSGKSYALNDRTSWKAYYAERFPAPESIEPQSPAAAPAGDARRLDSASP